MKRAGATMRQEELVTADALVEEAWRHQTWDPNTARVLAGQALACALEERSRRAEAYARYNLAFCELNVGDLQKGLDWLEGARVLFEELADERGRWLVQHGYFWKARRSASGKELLLTAERLDAQLGDFARPEDRLRMANHLAFVYCQLDRYDEALRRYHQALHIAQEAGLQHLEVNALNNIGGLLGSLHDVGDAIPLFERALEQAVRLAARPLLGVIAINLAAAYSLRGAADKQMDVLQAHIIGHEDEYHFDPSVIELAIARAYLETGNADEAWRRLHSPRHAGNAIAGINGDMEPLRAWITAALLLERGQAREALECCQRHWVETRSLRLWVFGS